MGRFELINNSDEFVSLHSAALNEGKIMSKAPHENEDNLLHGDHTSQRNVPYTAKEVRDVGAVSCKHCWSFGTCDKDCKKNN